MSSTNEGLKAALTQVFRVAVPEGVTGMYVTSIDLFFRKKSKSFGVELNLVELKEGQPDLSKSVPNSSVRISAEAVKVSENSATATKFKFQQPVFLSAGARYAIVVRGLGGAPDFELWTGTNGALDIRTGKSISSNPLSEQAYFAKSTTDWAEIPNEDLKYVIYRAKFNTGTAASAMLKKAPTELLQLQDVKYATGYPDIKAGDEIFGMSSTGLRNSAVYGMVDTFDSVNNILYVRNSTGKFAKSQNVMIVRSSVEGRIKPATEKTGVLLNAKIFNILDFPAHTVIPKIGNQTNSLGTVSFDFRGTYKEGSPLLSIKETSNSAWKVAPNQEELDFYDKTRYILSHSTEKSELLGASSVEVRGKMTSNTNFISPIIDLRERSLIAVKNLIGANTAGEDGDYGAARTRYISKVITLADGQEAEDLKVYITAYKPPRTIVQVYAKVWNPEDADDFDKKKWTLLTQVTEATLFSDPKNQEDYREFEFDVPAVAPVAGAAYSPRIDDPVAGDPIRYITDNGTFIGFKKYALKVVMAVTTDDDAYNYPRLSDIRAIALQK